MRLTELASEAFGNGRSPAGGCGAAAMFKSARGYCPWGTSSTRRFWARPSAVALVATNWVLP